MSCWPTERHPDMDSKQTQNDATELAGRAAELKRPSDATAPLLKHSAPQTDDPTADNDDTMRSKSAPVGQPKQFEIKEKPKEPKRNSESTQQTAEGTPRRRQSGNYVDFEVNNAKRKSSRTIFSYTDLDPDDLYPLQKSIYELMRRYFKVTYIFLSSFKIPKGDSLVLVEGSQNT